MEKSKYEALVAKIKALKKAKALADVLSKQEATGTTEENTKTTE